MPGLSSCKLIKMVTECLSWAQDPGQPSAANTTSPASAAAAAAEQRIRQGRRDWQRSWWQTLDRLAIGDQPAGDVAGLPDCLQPRCLAQDGLDFEQPASIQSLFSCSLS